MCALLCLHVEPLERIPSDFAICNSEVDLIVGVALLKCGMFLCSIPGGYLRRRPAGTEMATAIMVNIYTLKLLDVGDWSSFYV